MICFFPSPQDLLCGQFNVTLGDKMTEHLKKWIEAEKFISPPPKGPLGDKQV